MTYSKAFRWIVSLSIATQFISHSSTAYAWATQQSTASICESNIAKIAVSFKNTEYVSEEIKTNYWSMNVIATDQNTNKSIDLGTVKPGETKTGIISTQSQSTSAGNIKFDLTWTDGRKGIDSRTSAYSAKECVVVTPTPTPTPTATPTPKPTSEVRPNEDTVAINNETADTTTTVVDAQSSASQPKSEESKEKKLSISKQVQDANGNFVEKIENISKGQTIVFKIKVKNNGKTDVSNVEVIDELPNAFEKISGELSKDLGNLEKGDSYSYYIEARIKSGYDVTGKCITNEAKVEYKSNGKTHKADDDDATVCFMAKDPIMVLPKTGDNGYMNLVIIFASAGMITFGLGLRKID